MPPLVLGPSGRAGGNYRYARYLLLRAGWMTGSSMCIGRRRKLPACVRCADGVISAAACARRTCRWIDLTRWISRGLCQSCFSFFFTSSDYSLEDLRRDLASGRLTVVFNFDAFNQAQRRRLQRNFYRGLFNVSSWECTSDYVARVKVKKKNFNEFIRSLFDQFYFIVNYSRNIVKISVKIHNKYEKIGSNYLISRNNFLVRESFN